jgi:uncharacterized protein (TIGR03435 family)
MRWCPRVGTGFVSVVLVASMGGALRAQSIAGTWQGTLEGGKEQRIVVKISQDKAEGHTGWQGVVYNLDSDMAYEGRATTQMSLQGADLRFAIASVDGSYAGKLSADGGSITGTWTQGGQRYALSLVRANGDAAWEIPKADAAMAKDADPDWEVVTVRPSEMNVTNTGFHLDGRHVNIVGQTVAKMLLLGYGLQKAQIIGGPDWIETERWDVKGIPDVPGQPGLKQMQGMVRKVLAERFGFKSHTETRELAVYAITVAKGGAKLAKSAGDPNGLLDEEDGESAGQQTMQLTNASMGDFALILEFFMDRPVVDQTGLAGRFDFKLKWTSDDSRAPTDGSAAPGIFTAVQEQLGLKLDAVKAPTDVLMIDHVERPSAN